jgi:hypothetical protein
MAICPQAGNAFQYRQKRGRAFSSSVRLPQAEVTTCFGSNQSNSVFIASVRPAAGTAVAMMSTAEDLSRVSANSASSKALRSQSARRNE